jgi:hypothetical protein
LDEQYAERRGDTMVKVGFIVEGTSDKIILSANKFQNLLKYKLELDSNESLIHIAHNKTKLKENYVSLYRRLINKGAEKIFTLVDQDDKEAEKKNRKYIPPDCPLEIVHEILSYRSNRNYRFDENIFIVMVREMEAWFLADNELNLIYSGNPEDIIKPSELIEKQFLTSQHIIIANRVKNRFSLERAAENAPSAKRFLEKLQLISNQSEILG